MIGEILPRRNGSTAGSHGGDAPTGSGELRGENLSLTYPSADGPVVECDSVVVPAGEITALVGPNGSGKSTLLRALAGQLAPTAGEVLLDGSDVSALGAKQRARRIGLLAQENDAPADATVEDLVDHGRYPHRGTFEGRTDADEEAVDRALSLTGIGHLRDQRVADLSGGQKQLAWIAMVLAQETDVLLLDEPTTYLDLQHGLRVMEVLRELNERRDLTVGVVLHDLSRASRYADNLVAMDGGEPYDWGPPDAVVTEALLAEVFGVDADVEATTDGPRIDPRRSLNGGGL